ncbi:hypothetical protein N431DRAFT_358359 [Stipitochalara longipes BDJ]|nr:hypothetical protein N431DRAFT_358359 [Stipitochalara longipes BDJ]
MWERYERFGRAARRFCFQLRESMTSTGIVSMVPHQTEVGDFVVVIKGVCVPMVLREVNGFDGSFVDAVTSCSLRLHRGMAA